MAIIPRSAEDLIIDEMVDALRAFEARERAQDPSVGFTVRRDQLRPPATRDLPLVNVWLESLAPEGNGSGRTVGQETATIIVDCYARGDEDTDTTADEVAMARLYYLKEQVKAALFALVNADFGLPAGSIGKKRWPRFSLFQNDLKLPEDQVVAGRWTIEVEYNWTPEDSSSVALDEIAVSQTSRATWSAVYEYGGNP